MIHWPQNGAAVLRAKTWHGRLDGPNNEFAYSLDLLLMRVWPKPARLPFPFTSYRLGPLSVRDKDHGVGSHGMGSWAVRHGLQQGLIEKDIESIWLLTQPRRFGCLFNPVSFWFFVNQTGTVSAALAEVNNTYGDRHTYFCRSKGEELLENGASIELPKRFHVSPFQDIKGTYLFRFNLSERFISISIDHRHENGGLQASLSGSFKEMSLANALRMAAKRPFGGISVKALIHWQALKLLIKGAVFRKRPNPPTEDITA
jgi:DUF1365 family protein